MRISDWSSDVCSSDLEEMIGRPQDRHIPRAQRHHRAGNADVVKDHANNVTSDVRFLHLMYVSPQTCRSTGCGHRSEEHTSELQSLMRISYADFCLKKQTNLNTITKQNHTQPHTS